MVEDPLGYWYIYVCMKVSVYVCIMCLSIKNTSSSSTMENFPRIGFATEEPLTSPIGWTVTRLSPKQKSVVCNPLI